MKQSHLEYSSSFRDAVILSPLGERRMLAKKIADN